MDREEGKKSHRECSAFQPRNGVSFGESERGGSVSVSDCP